MRGLTQVEVARRSGIGAKTISAFETGERIDSMTVLHLLKILMVYGIAPSNFFRWTPERQL
jgi:transcriptional regulator with XRE-family HTH domain